MVWIPKYRKKRLKAIYGGDAKGFAIAKRM
jgi:hypothetical protein